MTVTTIYSFALTHSIALPIDSLVADVAPLSFYSAGFALALSPGGAASSIRLYNSGDIQIGSANSLVGTDPHLIERSDGKLLIVLKSANGIEYYERAPGGAPSFHTTLGTSAESAPDITAFNSNGLNFAIVTQYLVFQGNNDIKVYFRNTPGSVFYSSDFFVDTSTADDRAPAITTLADGGFVVVWERHVGNATQAWRAVYNGDGTVRAAPAAFDTNGTVNDSLSVAALKTGGFAAAYADNQYVGGAQHTSVAIFDANGVLKSITMAADNNPEETEQHIVTLSNGMIVTESVDGLQDFLKDTVISLIDPANGALLASARVGASHNSVYGEGIAATGSTQLVAAYRYDDVIDGGDVGAQAARYQLVRTSTGDSGNDTVNGDDAVDIINGGDGNNRLSGGGNNDSLFSGTGSDRLDGGTGADKMAGGAGNDTYVVDNAGDVITELANEGTDTVESSITHTLSAHVERLMLTGSGNLNGTGNELDNQLFGNDGDNQLSGLAGSDYLDGKLGADRMIGGAGDDTYVVDNIGDRVVELSNGGNDIVRSSISFKLPANVENLLLTGTGDINATGNDLDNTLTGNSGNNVLNGGIGADTMKGADGDDTYVVDDPGDVVVEGVEHGIDTVRASVDFILANNIENLTLTGTDGLNGTGNGRANTLTGNAGNNKLDGGLGADRMVGGKGDDTYVVDNLGDTVVEGVGQGTDAVIAKVSFTLANNVENLTLTGTGPITGTGNGLANAILGNSGNNVIDGKAGNDFLTGGAGKDTFKFNTALNATTNVDTITDYAVGVDHIGLDHAVFTTLGAGNLAQTAFAYGAPTTTSQHILYEAGTGAVSYDKDGSGAADAIEFAHVTPGTMLTFQDFIVL